MRQLQIKRNLLYLIVLALAMFSFKGTYAQVHDKYVISNLELMEDENMDYLDQIYQIVKDYPAFSYEYTIEDGEIKDVVVEGVDNNLERKRLEIVLFDLKKNKNLMKNQANRIGVFYSVDEHAEYKQGWNGLRNEILSNIEYPDDIKNQGVEGTDFVKFVVDENGEIPYLTTSSNMESNVKMFVEKLEEEAARALKSTSGNWEPSLVEGEEVASMVVVPVTFDYKQDPFLPKLVQ